MREDASARAARSRDRSAVVVAALVAAAGAYIAIDSLTGLNDPGYAEVGPAAIPLVGSALALAGLALGAQAMRGAFVVAWIETGEGSAASTVRSLVLIVAALAVNLLMFAAIGFVAASALLFAGVAAAFGSRRPAIDVALGLAFAAAVYLIFALGLGLELPAGSLWKELPWTR